MDEHEILQFLKIYLEQTPITRGNKGIRLAARVAYLVVEQDIKLGSAFPNQAKLVAHLSISKSAGKAMWESLAKGYRIILTSKRLGTRIVKELSIARRKEIRNHIAQHSYVSSELQMDWTSLFAYKPGFVKEITRELSDAAMIAANNRMTVDKMRMPEILASLINERTNFQYTAKEVVYANRHDTLLIKVLESIGEKGKSMCAIGAQSPLQHRLFQSAGYLYGEGSFNGTDPISAIDQIRQLSSINVVYVQLAGFYPMPQGWDELSWRKLFEVQEKKGFKIIINDYFVGIPGAVHLYKQIPPRAKDDVIFITKASNHVQFHEIWMAAGSEAIIKSITKKINRSPKDADPWIGLALSNLTTDGRLQKADEDAMQNAQEIAKVGEQYLLDSEKFKADYIVNRTTFCFYISPRDGTIPDGFYKSIKEYNIYVFARKDYGNVFPFEDGLLISTAKYTDANLLKVHLDIFISLLGKSKRASHGQKKIKNDNVKP